MQPASPAIYHKTRACRYERAVIAFKCCSSVLLSTTPRLQMAKLEGIRHSDYWRFCVPSKNLKCNMQELECSTRVSFRFFVVFVSERDRGSWKTGTLLRLFPLPQCDMMGNLILLNLTKVWQIPSNSRKRKWQRQWRRARTNSTRTRWRQPSWSHRSSARRCWTGAEPRQYRCNWWTRWTSEQWA